MTVLVIGSIALDSLETPFGTAENVLGGAGSYFSLAASTLTPVQLVGVVGSDLDERHLDTLRALGVLDQVRHPKFVGLDSMNFWIGNPDTKSDLTEVIKRVNAVFMNDGEIRQYTGKYNLFEAARQVLALGPQVVLMKKGEHGAVAVAREGVFVAAAYPLDSVKDPTGAGDSFAGGFMGYLAESQDTSWEGIKRAMVFGSVIASFAVETFGTDGLLTM